MNVNLHDDSLHPLHDSSSMQHLIERSMGLNLLRDDYFPPSHDPSSKQHLILNNDQPLCLAHYHEPKKPIACILAMARATPSNRIDQSTYADFYFNVTNTSHKVELKKKFARICERSGIQTRYSILTEEFLKAHPEFYTPGQPSLEERDAVFAKEVPKLAHEAGLKAIQEWGRPASEITHLIVTTLTGVAIPGADVALVKSLALSPSVNRIMLYMLGCYAGITALRIAKDLAENNPSARILICCSELAAPTFRAPDEKHTYDLVASALFGDGASGVIVGAKPNPISAHLMPNSSPNLAHVGAHCKSNPISCSPHLNLSPNSAHPTPLSAQYEVTNRTSADPSPNIQAHNGAHRDINSAHLSPHPGQNGANLIRSSTHPTPNSVPDGANSNPHSAHQPRPYPAQNGAKLHPNSAHSSPNDPLSQERPLYEIHWAGEVLAPDTESIIEGKLKLEGLQFYLDKSLPSLVGKYVGPFCREALDQATDAAGQPFLGLGFNDIFWAVHAGGPAILNAVEEALELEPRKLGASREILRSYGNISASTVLFVLDELRRSPHDESEWGLAVAFGPGVTIEGALVRRPPHT